MHIGPSPAGRRAVTFEPGDYVLLTHDECDANPTAFQGDWGRVIRVDSGMLDIQLAGHGRSRSAALDRVLGLPTWAVVHCDHHGRPATPVRERIRPVARAAVPADPRRYSSLLAWLLGAGALGWIALIGLVLR